MKNPFTLLVFLLLFVQQPKSQLCPGGGVNFNTAATFDPSWIYGCNTGTSCNGGVNFDNRISCQPTISLDACAPAPTCGSIGNGGSNIWFKFFATGTTASISCFQNTSLVIAVQAFSGGPACGSLVDIGCAVSGGPSSGVQLNLSGLVPAAMYYFRIFGSAGPVSQRTGLYCFCGSSGLNNFIVLPASEFDLTTTVTNGNITLRWNEVFNSTKQEYSVEHGINESELYTLAGSSIDYGRDQANMLTVTDSRPFNGINYYRIKRHDPRGYESYSPVIAVRFNQLAAFAIHNLPDGVSISSNDQGSLFLVNGSGQTIQAIHVFPGKNHLNTNRLSRGIYFLQNPQTGDAKKFFVY
jgi:hypothetical protein